MERIAVWSFAESLERMIIQTEDEAMNIAAVTFRLRASWVHSLKEKQMIVKSLTAQMARQERTEYTFDEYSPEPDYPFPMDD